MSVLIHTVQFNKPVIFTDHTGVTFHNITTAEDVANTGVASAEVSPSDIIEYSVTWVTDPVEGDVIEWRYTPGNYEDTDGNAMDAGELILTNCLDPVGVSLWVGETGDQWLTEDTSNWILE